MTADTSATSVQRVADSVRTYEYLLVLLAAGALYAATAAPGPLWQDSGLAQVRVLRHDLRGGLGLALSHPLFYVIAIAVQAVPWGESAYSTNLVASLFGAVTVANVYLLLRLLRGRTVAAAVGAVSLGVAHTFWQHCTLAEVYTVSTALLTAELLCLAQYARTGQACWLVLLFLANGLGVSNHLLALLNLPVWGVLLLWLLVRHRVRGWTLPACAVAWLLGASIYLALVIGELASGAPAGDVLRSALFGTHYAANVLNTRLDARLLGRTVLYLGLNFPTPVALLALVGLRVLWRSPVWGLMRALLALLAVHLVWAMRYDVPDQYTFFIPTIVLLAILIGLGAERVLAARGRGGAIGALVLAALPVLVYWPLPRAAQAAGVSLGVRRDVPYRDSYRYFLWPWKTGEHGPRRFAEEVHAGLPDGALIVADSTTVPPLHYLMATGRWTRPVEVWPALGALEVPDDAVAEIEERLRAGLVYVVSPVRGYCPRWLLERCEFEPAGSVYRARPTGRSTW